jgi:dTDP-4-amino-4,6-dideoxygalactose transaminase
VLAAAILHANAVPIFADIDRKTLHRLNPTTDTTKAVVIAHLAGYPAEMEAFKKLADRHGLYIVENAAPLQTVFLSRSSTAAFIWAMVFGSMYFSATTFI